VQGQSVATIMRIGEMGGGSAKRRQDFVCCAIGKFDAFAILHTAKSVKTTRMVLGIPRNVTEAGYENL
jgi:hypothetical protein